MPVLDPLVTLILGLAALAIVIVVTIIYARRKK
jgi:hypothetical protein